MSYRYSILCADRGVAYVNRLAKTIDIRQQAAAMFCIAVACCNKI
ncbi:MAG: hypothetical protein ACI4HK_08150 [Ruminococcus sp.]